MDPLSITASVVGLLTTTGSVVSILSKVKAAIGDAPRLMDQLLLQVNELETVFSVVNQFLVGITEAPRQRTSMIQVDQLVATLTDAILTFPELGALIAPLGEGSEISMRRRMKLARKDEKNIQYQAPTRPSQDFSVAHVDRSAVVCLHMFLVSYLYLM
jgi:hypothetical protein